MNDRDSYHFDATPQIERDPAPRFLGLQRGDVLQRWLGHLDNPRTFFLFSLLVGVPAIILAIVWSL